MMLVSPFLRRCSTHRQIRLLVRHISARHMHSNISYVLRSRAARSERRAMSLACEDDTELAERFVYSARRSLGNAARCKQLFEPLVAIWDLSVRGQLPSSEWDAQLATLSQQADVLSLSQSPWSKSHRWSDLRSLLHKRTPCGAHETRLRSAMRLLPDLEPDGQSALNAALCVLMEGAIRCNSPKLQHELLQRFRGLAVAEGLGLVGLLQAPLLHRACTPEADDVPTAMEEQLSTWLNDYPLSPAPTLDAVGVARGKDGAQGVACLLAAAKLARRGGPLVDAQHGCVLVEGSRVLGCGFNHTVSRADRKAGSKPVVVHAEAHAIADAIRRHGECIAFAAFPRATAWIVELVGTVGYDDAHPCPKCEGMLRAVGVRVVRHTSGGTGAIASRTLGPPLPHLLSDTSVCSPLGFLLRVEFGGVPCERLGHDVMQSTFRDLRVTTSAYWDDADLP